MRRRVVHSRIRSRVVYSCYLIQERYGLHPETKAMSTVISEVLESLINRLIEQGDLTSYNDEEADRKISEWLMEVPEDSDLDIQISTDNLGFGPGEEERSEPRPAFAPDEAEHEQTEPGTDEEAKAAGEEIVNTILGYAAQSGEENLFRDNEGSEAEEEESEPPLAEIAPWEQDNILNIEKLQEEVKQSDEVAQLALNGDDVDIRALQIVYSQIPRELWGSERSSTLIEQVKPTVERYVAAGY